MLVAVGHRGLGRAPVACDVRFTLTYDGPLHISGNAQAKQDVRERLHPNCGNSGGTRP